MSASVLLGAVAATALFEMIVLWRLVHHPAGGWGEDPAGAFLRLGAWAAAPLLVSAGRLSWVVRRKARP